MQPTAKSVRTFAVIMLFISVAFTSYPQESRFSISLNSLTTNFNYGSLDARLKDYKKSYSGFQAGFSYQAGITPMFSVVPELYLAMKGGSLKANNPLTGATSTLKVNSLELPVLARVHCKKLYLNAGPYVGYNVGGRMKVDGTPNTPAKSTGVSFGNATGDLNRWDAGFQVGSGYKFNLKRSVLVLDVRYGYGLTTISHDVQRYHRMLNISIQVSHPEKKAGNRRQG